jgi:hypothetical protein
VTVNELIEKLQALTEEQKAWQVYYLDTVPYDSRNVPTKVCYIELLSYVSAVVLE